MSIPASALQNLTDLKTPTDQIKWRQGPGGKQLAYVDARYVMGVLDALVGPENWQRVHLMDGQKVACGIGIHVEYQPKSVTSSMPALGEWVWKWDGAGETDIEGEKGSFSDSFKRAAVLWGIGRDLYSMQPQGAPQRPTAVTNRAPSPQATPPDNFDLSDLEQPARFAPVGGSCPVHHKPWTLKPAGISKAGNAYDAFWKCDGKSEGRYCDQKPTKAWAAAHEV